jgi:hypothetical protein
LVDAIIRAENFLHSDHPFLDLIHVVLAYRCAFMKTNTERGGFGRIPLIEQNKNFVQFRGEQIGIL